MRLSSGGLRSGTRRLAPLAAACALAACQATPGAPTPELYTTADLQRLLDTTGAETTIAEDAGVPGGLPLSLMIAKGAGQDTLVPRMTLTGESETYRSAYVTTEVWTRFDEVWIQPMYVLVDGYGADGTPIRHKFGTGATAAWRPIFGVGAQSKFYSPYWQEIYFELPTGADPESFRSVRDVVDRGAKLNPAGGRVVSLVPATVSPPAPTAGMDGGPVAIGGPTAGAGLIDGARAPFLDFGEGTFTWNDDLVVQEIPLFVWVARDSSGQLQRLDIPTVAAAGPLYSNTTNAKTDDNLRPQYGSYWRIYTVEIPAGMGVFAPPVTGDESVRAGLGTLADLSMDAKYGPTVLSAPSTAIIDYLGRVATNPDCFSDVMNTNGNGCTYLDSQTKIEMYVPNDLIRRTDILVTCPFVTYDEKALTLP
jgi:hypothetical protein